MNEIKISAALVLYEEVVSARVELQRVMVDGKAHLVKLENTLSWHLSRLSEEELADYRLSIPPGSV